MRTTYLLPALTAAAMLLTGTAAPAHQTAPAPAATEDSNGGTAAKPKKEKKICRGEENSYSRMAARTCKTQAEWDAAGSRPQSDKPRVTYH